MTTTPQADAVGEALTVSEMLARAMDTEASLLVSIVGRSVSASDVTLLRQGAAVIREQESRLAALTERVAEQQAEISRLRKECDLRAHAVDRYIPCPDHRDKVERGHCLACRAERAEASEREAARYRWLRDNCKREWQSDMPHNKGAPSLDIEFEASGHDLDAAIDAAMRSHGVGG